jgi:hypothetical protein
MLSDTEEQITAYIFDVVRSTVPTLKLDDVFTAKVEIARDVKEELQKQMAEFGYSILQALVTDIDPEQKVFINLYHPDPYPCPYHDSEYPTLTLVPQPSSDR